MPKRFWAVMGMIAALAACGPSAPRSAAPSGAGDLIQRAALFGAPERREARLSPDGKWFSYLERREGKTALVAAQIADRADARVLAPDVTDYAWSADGAFMLYRSTADGFWHAMDLLATGEDRVVIEPEVALFPASPARPGKIAFRLPPENDLYELDIRSGDSTPIYRNRDGFADFLLDAQNQPRVAAKSLAGGAREIRALAPKPAKLLIVTPADAPNTRFIGVAPDGKSFLLVSTIGRPRAALMRVDLATGAVTVMAEDGAADVASIWRTPSTGEIEAYSAAPAAPRWTALNQIAAADLAALKKALQGPFEIVSRSGDNARWIVREQGPAIAPRFHLYSRAAKTVEKLFSEYPPLDGRVMAPAKLIEIPARDGAKLPALLLTPRRTPARALIIVARDPQAPALGGFDADAQFFADRGSATLVLPVGGGGFGRALALRADKGAADIADAATWAAEQKLAASNKLAIVAPAPFLPAQPNAFSCAVALAGAGDASATIVQSKRPTMWAQRGITKEQAAPLIAALKTSKAPVAVALFPDEQKDFSRAENRIAFHALAGAFLAGCLGGQAEPIGADLNNSSVQMLAGTNLIPTFDAAMAPRESEAGAPP